MQKITATERSIIANALKELLFTTMHFEVIGEALVINLKRELESRRDSILLPMNKEDMCYVLATPYGMFMVIDNGKEELYNMMVDLDHAFLEGTHKEIVINKSTVYSDRIVKELIVGVRKETERYTVPVIRTLRVNSEEHTNFDYGFHKANVFDLCVKLGIIENDVTKPPSVVVTYLYKEEGVIDDAPVIKEYLSLPSLDVGARPAEVAEIIIAMNLLKGDLCIVPMNRAERNVLFIVGKQHMLEKTPAGFPCEFREYKIVIGDMKTERSFFIVNTELMFDEDPQAHGHNFNGVVFSTGNPQEDGMFSLINLFDVKFEEV